MYETNLYIHTQEIIIRALHNHTDTHTCSATKQHNNYAGAIVLCAQDVAFCGFVEDNIMHVSYKYQ